MAEGLIAGFDAGQTHTTCRLASSRDGTILAEGEGPGVTHLAAAGGSERFVRALQTSLAKAQAFLHSACPGDWLTTAPVLAAAVGASGIEVGSPVQGQGRQLTMDALGLPEARVIATGDERTALRGAFGGGAGIVVISGTGTITVGRATDGREHRCAGWGWLLDGAGSATDIGRDGLALSLRMADGRIPERPLRATLWRALEFEPADPSAPQRIKALVAGPAFGAAGFAGLAPVINHLAEGGDGHAQAILLRSAEALVDMVRGVAGALALDAPKVCAVGGAIENLGHLRELFHSALEAELPNSLPVPPMGDACDGALAMAAELLR